MPEFLGRLRTPRLAAPPASPVVGELYYDTVANILYYWDGAAWVSTKSSALTIYDSDQVGTVKAFSGQTLPTNWMLADGRSLPTASYPDLFAAIGYKYGGSGANFNLPDLRSKFIYGVAQTDLSDIGQGGGAATVTLTAGQMPSHNHGGSTSTDTPDHSHSGSTNTDGAHIHDYPGSAYMLNAAGATFSHATGGNTKLNATSVDATVQTNSSAHSHAFSTGGASARHTHTISTAGSDQAHENMPPYIRLVHMIKVMGAAINAGGALQGATGAKGDPGPWRGAWSAATAYAVGDAVSYYDGSVTGTYRRKVAGTTAGDPKTDTTNWEIIASGGSIGANGAPGANGYTPSGRAKSAAYAITADTNARFLNPALTVDFDSIGGNCFTANQGRFTAPVAGRYLVGFTITELGNGTASIGVILNATTILKRITAAGGTGADGTKAGIECWDIYNLNAGDNLMIHGWSSGGGSTNIIAVEAIRLDASTAWGGAPTVTSLPASPVDGQEVYFVADATNGVIWHLRYRAAAPGSYKWEYVGGSSLTAFVNAYENCTSNGAYADLTTVGPSITVPLAGDYIYTLSADIRPPSGFFCAMGPKWGAAAVADDDAAWASGAGATAHSAVSEARVNGVAANALCKCQYKNNGTVSATLIGRRKFSMRPVRVG